ncbi:MAG: hypothetical protein EP338_13815 [Bacteroidetes bacterium]|nr:MAG: hypothetical protein EP338_13815 [Bacteroidota bacterium]
MKLLIGFILSGVLFYSCCDVSCQRQRYAEKLIERIEDFQQIHQRLPNSVRELGFKESEQSKAYYEKTGDHQYQVWYGTSLGRSMVYRSERKKWLESGD